MDGLRIVNERGEWVLPDMAWITGVPVKAKQKKHERALQHGVILSGDNKIDSRALELHLYILENSEAAYTSARDGVMANLYSKGMRLFIYDRSIELSGIDSVKEEFFSGFLRRRAEIIATFVCADPFWYASAEESISRAITATPEIIHINSISGVDTPPVITVTAIGAVPYIKITNAANDRMCIYQDPQMIAGQVLVIDTATATVKRNGANTINAFAGTFHQLEVGDNTFTVECSPTCTVTITYTPRWL